MTDIVILLGALLVILLGAELFTNGIEWFGHKLGLAEGAVGSVLAAVGTALPETMIPLIAILFGGGVGRRGRHRGDPRRAVHARDPGDVRDRGRDPDHPAPRHDRRDARRQRQRPRPRHALLRGRLRAGDRRRLPARRPRLAALRRRRRPARDLRATTSGSTSRPRPAAATRSSRRSASIGSTSRGPAHPEPPRLRIVGLQVAVALGCIIAGAYLFVGAVTDLAHSLGRRRGPARPDHRPDRDRAAREVQQRDLGPPGQGHPGDGQHHRRDGLPERDPDLGRARVRVVRLGGRPAARCWPSRRPASRSLSSAVIFLPLARGRPADAPGCCSSAGSSTCVYLGLVVARAARSAATGAAPDREPPRPLLYSADARRRRRAPVAGRHPNRSPTSC